MGYVFIDFKCEKIQIEHEYRISIRKSISFPSVERVYIRQKRIILYASKFRNGMMLFSAT